MTNKQSTREHEPLSLLDRSLAVWPGFQMGPQAQSTRVERKDFLGLIARADHAPLGEVELDMLTWISAQWWGSGRNADGMVRFTLYAARKALYGPKTADTNNRRVLEALDNLKAAVITVNGINVFTGAKARFSKVNLLDGLVLADQITLFNDGSGTYDPTAVGGLRGSTVEIRLAPWLVSQLTSSGGVALDWAAQRRLSGQAKRLWIHLASSAVDWVQDAQEPIERCAVALTEDLYNGLGVACARPRDGRAAIVRAARRILIDDAAYLDAFVSAGTDAQGDKTWALCIERQVGTGRSVGPAMAVPLAA